MPPSPAVMPPTAMPLGLVITPGSPAGAPSEAAGSGTLAGAPAMLGRDAALARVARACRFMAARPAFLLNSVLLRCCGGSGGSAGAWVSLS